MTPLLLAPLGLAALAALVVPLLVHLRRRTEEVPLDFAALRWLDPRPRPRRRLRFDEWLLLALRLLLVALLALLLALCTAQLAMMQGDRFGWIALHGHGLVVADPHRGRAQFERMQIELMRLESAGTFPDPATLAPLWERIGPNDLVLFLSDCFDEGGIAMIERLAKAGREVLAVQLLTVEERDFPFDGGYRFREQESGAALVGDGKALRDSFLARFAEARAALAERLDAAGIRHTAYVLDEAIDRPLHVFFGRGAPPA